MPLSARALFSAVAVAAAVAVPAWAGVCPPGGGVLPSSDIQVPASSAFGGARPATEVFLPPASSSSSGAMPLILALHGGGSNGLQAAYGSQLHVSAGARGVAVAYPSGLFASQAGNPSSLAWNAGPLCCGIGIDQNVDDVGFLRQVVADVASAVPGGVDRRRVYATGLSNGGMMAYRLALDAPDLVAAIAPAGCTWLMYNASGCADDSLPNPNPITVAEPFSEARCPRSNVGSYLFPEFAAVGSMNWTVPTMHYHGARDKYSPLPGGIPAVVASADSITFWPRRAEFEWMANLTGPSCSLGDGSFLGQLESSAFNSTTNEVVTVRSYTRCAAVNLTFVLSSTAGHTWPSGAPPRPCCAGPDFNQNICNLLTNSLGESSTLVDGRELMLDFFQRFALPEMPVVTTAGASSANITTGSSGTGNGTVATTAAAAVTTGSSAGASPTPTPAAPRIASTASSVSAALATIAVACSLAAAVQF